MVEKLEAENKSVIFQVISLKSKSETNIVWFYKHCLSEKFELKKKKYMKKISWIGAKNFSINLAPCW